MTHRVCNNGNKGPQAVWNNPRAELQPQGLTPGPWDGSVHSPGVPVAGAELGAAGPGTFGGAELHGLRHGPHALGVPGLDLEEVGGVQGELLDLVCEPVPHHGLDHPVVDLGVDVRAVVDDVPWAGKRQFTKGHKGTGRCSVCQGNHQGLSGCALTLANTKTIVKYQPALPSFL